MSKLFSCPKCSKEFDCPKRPAKCVDDFLASCPHCKQRVLLLYKQGRAIIDPGKLVMDMWEKDSNDISRQNPDNPFCTKDSPLAYMHKSYMGKLAGEARQNELLSQGEGKYPIEAGGCLVIIGAIGVSATILWQLAKIVPWTV